MADYEVERVGTTQGSSFPGKDYNTKRRYTVVLTDRLEREYNINVWNRETTGTRGSFQKWLAYLTGEEEERKN